MSQDWVSDLYTTGTVGDTTLSNMELMFATLRSMFSGSSAPSNPVNGNPWYDTDTHLLKLYRNAAWVGVLAGSASFKIWVYRNTAEDGWSIDGTVTDKVLALKGGSTYTTGAATAGSWTLSGITAANESSHYHSMQSHSHVIPYSGYTYSTGQLEGYNTIGRADTTVGGIGRQSANRASGGPSTANTGAGSSHGHNISHDGTDRIAAAVGTMQYPNTT